MYGWFYCVDLCYEYDCGGYYVYDDCGYDYVYGDGCVCGDDCFLFYKFLYLVRLLYWEFLLRGCRDWY